MTPNAVDVIGSNWKAQVPLRPRRTRRKSGGAYCYTPDKDVVRRAVTLESPAAREASTDLAVRRHDWTPVARSPSSGTRLMSSLPFKHADENVCRVGQVAAGISPSAVDIPRPAFSIALTRAARIARAPRPTAPSTAPLPSRSAAPSSAAASAVRSSARSLAQIQLPESQPTAAPCPPIEPSYRGRSRAFRYSAGIPTSGFPTPPACSSGFEDRVASPRGSCPARDRRSARSGVRAAESYALRRFSWAKRSRKSLSSAVNPPWFAQGADGSARSRGAVSPRRTPHATSCSRSRLLAATFGNRLRATLLAAPADYASPRSTRSTHLGFEAASSNLVENPCRPAAAISWPS